jgi:hypothetical protein
MKTAKLLKLVTCLAGALAAAAPAFAQDTRAGQAEQQRAAKAKQLRPYQPSAIEAALYRIEDRYLVERVFNPPRGVFLRFGGLPEGAGLAAGPGYRYSTYDWSFTATGAMSIRGSQEIEARLSVPPVKPVPSRAIISVGGHYRHLPQEDFFGLGNDSLQALRSTYTLDQTSGDVTGSVYLTKWFSIGGTAEYRKPSLDGGQDPRFPSIETFFPDAPGLDVQPDFLRFGGQAVLDYTDLDDGTRIGGRYAASYDKFDDRDFNRFSFKRWDLDLQQFVPIFTSGRLLALRAHIASATADAGHDVPFYLQPTLGGSHSIRSLRVTRLRDLNSLLMQAEYRWEVNAFLTGVLFYDTAKVAPRRQDLNFKELKDNFGIGLRLGFLNIAAIRAEAVFGGDEGTVIALRFGDVF